MARFYALAIEPTLFGDMALVREWGRIGSLAAVASIFMPALPPLGRRSTSGWLEKLGLDIKSEPQSRGNKSESPEACHLKAANSRLDQ
jgi:hypothetical protein